MIQAGSFPFVLGTDIVAISRFKLLPPNSLRKLSWRVLHPAEIGQTKHRFPEWHEFLIAPLDRRVIPKDNALFSQWLAGRWAAKEAARKAWGADLLGFRDVYVTKHDDDRPQIACEPWDGDTKRLAIKRSLQQTGVLSISHDGDYATATVMAELLQQELRDVFVKRKQSVQDSMDEMKANGAAKSTTFSDPSGLYLRRPEHGDSIKIAAEPTEDKINS